MSADRLTRLAEDLLHAFQSGPGVFGRTRRDMPEFVRTARVAKGDLVSFLTITATLDYQTDAATLWETAEQTYLDAETNWLFNMPTVAAAGIEAIKSAMLKHGFIGRYQNNNANYLHQVCKTFAARYGGSPTALLKSQGYDALALYRDRRRLGALPSLTGDKIFPFWLRILKDIAGIELANIEKVPLPVDVHTARATYRIVYQRRDKPDLNKDRNRIANDWSKVCTSTGTPTIYPLALDEALWLLSRYGCSRTDGQDHCPQFHACVVAQYCVFSQSGEAR